MARRTQAERREATRGALIAAARSLFAERGFVATGTEQIVERAGVTRGALYHHFEDKTALFRAVYETVETEVVARVMAAAEAAGQRAMDRLRAGIDAFLDACLEPEVHRIILVEAPTVLGWDAWRELDQQYGLGMIRTALGHAMDAGALVRQPIEPLAHVVLGALNEAALLLSRAEDPDAARAEIGGTVHRLLEGLRPPRP